MPEISERQYQTAYKAAKALYENEIDNAAALKMVTSIQMNRVSAQMYLDAYRHLRDGHVFKRTINRNATRYFLTQMRIDSGPDVQENALKALTLHIEYFEKVNGGHCRTLRQIVVEFGRNPTILRVNELADEFLKKVEKSGRLTEAQRNALLPKRGHKPRKSEARVTMFDRSPHVVAEVLRRAAGICERCKQGAPFDRRRDGKPYLEVHHIVTLANDGDDTVENAQALCPNCHRYLHHGV